MGDVGQAGKDAPIADDNDTRRQIGVAQAQADLWPDTRRLA
jgi:hypothetical protein